MFNDKNVTAIILSAGNSTRYGKNRNKNFEIIKAKTVIEYSIEAFEKNSYIDDIIITIKESDIEKIKKIVENVKHNKKIEFVIGGNTRKDSVYNSISKTNSQIVIIHDAARPLIKQDYINRSIESLNEYSGVTIGVKSKDTIKITDENGIVISTTNRRNTWIIQTPQCFNRDVLIKLHEKYNYNEVTDDCSLLEMEGKEIKVIEGDYSNIKITTYEDLFIVQTLLSSFKI